MKRQWLCLFLAVVCTHARSAQAADQTRVEALQFPVWIERGEKRLAMRLGATLAAGDTVHTGPGAGVRLRLAEGSQVKLGEKAVLNFAELSPSTRGSETFRGFLDVLRGAFRFTTTALGARRKRDVRTRIRSITLGIRGTDVWGKAASDRDFVVLLEGTVRVERDGERLWLSEPMSLFDAPVGGSAVPVAPVGAEDLQRWAAETELLSPSEGGGGTVDQAGLWGLVLGSFRDPANARALADSTDREGYATVQETITIGGTEWHRVVVKGLATEADARALAPRIARRFNLASPLVARLGQ